MQFEIDKNGNIVNIKARAAHRRLEKEAKRVLLKLPQMEPAKQRNRKDTALWINKRTEG